jgi:ABC-2 type transport system permease protein
MSGLTMVWRAEWMKFAAHPLQRRMAWLLLAVLLCSAVWSGLQARAVRGERERSMALVATEREKAYAASPLAVPNTPAQALKAAQTAFSLGKSELGLAWMKPSGALVLGVERLGAMGLVSRVTVESRHAEGHPPGPLTHPMLGEVGLVSFPSMVVLWLPLVLLVMTTASLQAEREEGTWRWVEAQGPRGGTAALLAFLGLRFAVGWGIAAATSTVAFLLDPAASATDWAAWLGHLAVYSACWFVIWGALCRVHLSAASAVLVGLGLWLAVSFVVPAALAWAARSLTPMPSRLVAIAELREVQQSTEAREKDLLADWYDRHPGLRPDPALAPAAPGWPVTFIPRYEAQEAELRPTMGRSDAVRIEQEQFIGRWAWLSPSLALVMAAERQAGVDAVSRERHAKDVDRFEDRWREFFGQRVMSYRGVVRADFADMPDFARDSPASVSADNGADVSLPLALLFATLAVCAMTACSAVLRGAGPGRVKRAVLSRSRLPEST